MSNKADRSIVFCPHLSGLELVVVVVVVFPQIPATGKAGKCGMLCGRAVSGPKDTWGTQKMTNEIGKKAETRKGFKS